MTTDACPASGTMRRMPFGYGALRGLSQRLPFGKVLVAMANNHARQPWAMPAHDEDYDAEAWLRHPMVQRPARHRTRAMAAWVGTAHDVQRQSEEIASGQTAPARA